MVGGHKCFGAARPWPEGFQITSGHWNKSRRWPDNTALRVLAAIASTIFWFALWTAIAAALLYPAVLWMANHTQLSAYFLTQAYVIGIAVLFLPTGFLVDFVYRRFISKKRLSN
jgi:cytochrome c biogenesis protein CcdA